MKHELARAGLHIADQTVIQLLWTNGCDINIINLDILSCRIHFYSFVIIQKLNSNSIT